MCVARYPRSKEVQQEWCAPNIPKIADPPTLSGEGLDEIVLLDRIFTASPLRHDCTSSEGRTQRAF